MLELTVAMTSCKKPVEDEASQNFIVEEGGSSQDLTISWVNTHTYTCTHVQKNIFLVV